MRKDGILLDCLKVLKCHLSFNIGEVSLHESYEPSSLIARMEEVGRREGDEPASGVGLLLSSR